MGVAKVEQIDCMGGVEHGGRLRLSLEPAQHHLGIPLAGRTQHFRTHDLDRRRPREETMLRAPDLAHPSVRKLLDELVAPQFACVADSAADSLKHDRREHGDDGAQVVRVVEEEGRGNARRREPAQIRYANGERIHRRGNEARGQHLERGRWRDHGVDENQDRVPGDIPLVGKRRQPLVDDGNGERVHDEQPQPEIERGLAWPFAPPLDIEEAGRENHDHHAANEIAGPRKRRGHAGRRQRVGHGHDDRPGPGANTAEQAKTLRSFLEKIVGQTSPRDGRIGAGPRVNLRRDTLSQTGHGILPRTDPASRPALTHPRLK